LEAEPTGPHLATLLEFFDPATLRDASLVDFLAAGERLKAWVDARQVAATLELSGRCARLRGVGSGGPEAGEMPVEAMAAAEIAPALRLCTRSAEERVRLAGALVRLAGTRGLLAAGELTLVKARVIVEAVAPLGDAEAAAVEARVLPRAPGQTVGQLQAALRRAVLAVDTAAAEARRVQARRRRGVWRRAIEDGMGLLTYVGALEDVEAAYQWISALARQAQHTDRAAARDGCGATARGEDSAHTGPAGPADYRRDAYEDLGDPHAGSGDDLGEDLADPGDPGDPGDPVVRTLEQCRADVLAELGRLGLAGRLPFAAPGGCGCGRLPTEQGRRPQIRVVVAASTLLGEDDEPGELIGVGPLSAAAARAVAAEGTWQRLLVEPGSGRLLELAVDTHDPPQQMRDFVVTRDATCRSPGCRAPASRCDLDYTKEYPCGPTCVGNLCALCRRHHRIKTLTDTRVLGDGRGGLTWTMPSGKTYTRPADPVLDHPALLRPPGRGRVIDLDERDEPVEGRHRTARQRPAVPEELPDEPPF